MEVISEFIIGMRRCLISKEDSAYEFPIRVDVSEEDIVGMIETMLLSCPGTMSKNLSLQTIELTLAPDYAKSTECQSLMMILGVKTMVKQRVLLVHMKRNQDTNKPKISFLSNSKSPTFTSFCQSIVDQLKAGLESSGISEGSQLISSDKNSSVDPAFIRDLQASYAMDMQQSLTKMAETLDYHVTLLEKKCAKLMTLLKPNYTRAFVSAQGASAVPIPPTKKSLLDYPLQLLRQSITEPDIEVSKLLLLRAKRCLDQANHDGSTKRPSVSRYDNDSILKLVMNELNDWVEEESKARIARKTASVKDRVESLDIFRENLVWRLHTRYTRAYIKQSNAVNTRLSLADESFTLSVEEEAFHQKTMTICRVFCEDEPVLLDLSVIMQGKKGTLYISVGHIYFQQSILSTSTISPWFSTHVSKQTSDSLSVTVIKVQSIGDISIYADNQVIVPNILSSKSSPTINLMTATPSSNEEMIIKLHNSVEEYRITVPPTAGSGFVANDYARRLADFLSILVKVDFYKISRAMLALPVHLSTQPIESPPPKSSLILSEGEISKMSSSNPFAATSQQPTTKNTNPFDDTDDLLNISSDMTQLLKPTDIALEINSKQDVYGATKVTDTNPFDDIVFEVPDIASKSNAVVYSTSAPLLDLESEISMPTTSQSNISNNLISQEYDSSWNTHEKVSLNGDGHISSPGNDQLISDDSRNLSKKPSLAKNIQAFLAQSQQKK